MAHGAPYSWEKPLPAVGGSRRCSGAYFLATSHLNLGENSPELREFTEQTLLLLSEYSTRVGQHEGLHNAYRDLRDGDHYAT